MNKYAVGLAGFGIGIGCSYMYMALQPWHKKPRKNTQSENASSKPCVVARIVKVNQQPDEVVLKKSNVETQTNKGPFETPDEEAAPEILDTLDNLDKQTEQISQDTKLDESEEDNPIIMMAT